MSYQRRGHQVPKQVGTLSLIAMVAVAKFRFRPAWDVKVPINT
jgi:hypothetical protein